MCFFKHLPGVNKKLQNSQRNTVLEKSPKRLRHILVLLQTVCCSIIKNDAVCCLRNGFTLGDDFKLKNTISLYFFFFLFFCEIGNLSIFLI
jgi:hypothetical protein